MKREQLFLIMVIIFLVPYYHISGQIGLPQRDKYQLLTMPYNQRPITLYRGQFQGNAGYKFAVRTQSYDSEGEVIYLRNTGTGSVYHYYFVELKYGLTDFIELAAETNFLKKGIRSESTTYVATTLTSSERVSVNKLTESKGMGDILLSATFRLPVEYKWFDLALRGGLYLPSARFEPEKPTHNITDITTDNTYTVNYQYKNTNGYGVPVYELSGSVKFTVRKFTLNTGIIFRDPTREGHNIRWEETLSENTFSYYNQSFSYLLSRTIISNTSLHYQATGWFDMKLNCSFQKSYGGWTEYWGNKYSNNEIHLLVIEPGFELQISPAMTIYQNAGFPIKGKNSDAPFYLFTTLRINMFPFLR